MEKEQKPHKTFQRIVFFIILPLLFLLVIAFILLSLFDFRPLDKVKEFGAGIPIVSKYVEEKPNDQEIIIRLEQEIDELQLKLEQRENELERKEEEITSLEVKYEKLDKSKNAEKDIVERKNDELKETARTYEAMQPKSAAAIISNLSIEDAIEHLTYVSIEDRAKILAKMDSEKAAEIISSLANE